MEINLDKKLSGNFRALSFNYNLKRKNRLIIVDELPNVLYEKLLHGDTMKFDPVHGLTPENRGSHCILGSFQKPTLRAGTFLFIEPNNKF